MAAELPLDVGGIKLETETTQNGVEYGDPRRRRSQQMAVETTEVTLKMEPGEPPKLARSLGQKVVGRPLMMYDHLPDKTAEAQQSFQMIQDCIYANKYIGSTEHDSMECDCAEEWGESI